MAKKKVHHKHHKKHRRHHHKGFLGNAGAMGHEVMETGISAIEILAGTIVANYAAPMIDNMLGVTKVTGSVSPTFDFKALVSPVVLLGLGVAGVHFSKGNSHIKHVSYGIAAGGLLHGVKQTLNPSFLQGLGDVYEPYSMGMSANYFRETEAQLEALKNASTYVPSFPTHGVNGFFVDTPQKNMQAIMGVPTVM